MLSGDILTHWKVSLGLLSNGLLIQSHRFLIKHAARRMLKNPFAHEKHAEDGQNNESNRRDDLIGEDVARDGAVDDLHGLVRGWRRWVIARWWCPRSRSGPGPIRMLEVYRTNRQRVGRMPMRHTVVTDLALCS